MNRVAADRALAAAFLIAIAGLAAAVFVEAPSESFREGYGAGLLATLIGVAVAIPLGLGADRWRQGLEQSHRRTQLLQAIRNDLASIAEDLASRMGQRTAVFVPFLGSGLWESVSASGQINDLDEPELLRGVARAYDRIAVTRYLERQVWELTVGVVIPDPMTSPLGTQPPMPRLSMAREALMDQDRHTRAAIEMALERIGSAGHRG